MVTTESERPVVVEIRAEIAKAARNPLVMATGYGGLLKLLDRYVVQTEARIARLESGAIRRGEQ